MQSLKQIYCYNYQERRFFYYNDHENVRLLSQAIEFTDVAIYIKEHTKVTALNQHQHFIFLQKACKK